MSGDDDSGLRMIWNIVDGFQEEVAEEEVSKRKDFRMRLKRKTETESGGSAPAPQPFLSRFFGSRRSGRRKKEEEDQHMSLLGR